jgi:hypothetical protein
MIIAEMAVIALGALFVIGVPLAWILAGRRNNEHR